MQSSGSDPVENLTVLIGNLEISIFARYRGADRHQSPPPVTLISASSTTTLTTSVAGPELPQTSWDRVESAVELPNHLVTRIIRSTTPHEYSSIQVAHLEPLLYRLRSSDQVWTPHARLVRAYRAGLLARRWLDGESSGEDSPAVPLRNSFYVVLRSRDNGPAFWTKHYNIYAAEVFVSRGGQQVFDRCAVSHAFASQAECSAYISGAQVAWPPEKL